jgi:hypothetical protein
MIPRPLTPTQGAVCEGLLVAEPRSACEMVCEWVRQSVEDALAPLGRAARDGKEMGPFPRLGRTANSPLWHGRSARVLAKRFLAVVGAIKGIRRR